jgi:predicted house-cleaning noncanonical NTP pyrophosphatase (MazG superfamily)
MRARGETPKFRIASPKELEALLLDKLLEEAAEFRANPTYEELADVMEVLEAIKRAHGVCPGELENVRLTKLAENGGFDGGVVLEMTALYDREGSQARRRAKKAALELSGYMGEHTRVNGGPPHDACNELIAAALALFEEGPVTIEDVQLEARDELARADREVAAASEALSEARERGQLSSAHGERLVEAQRQRNVIAQAFARVGLVP